MLRSARSALGDEPVKRGHAQRAGERERGEERRDEPAAGGQRQPAPSQRASPPPSASGRVRVQPRAETPRATPTAARSTSPSSSAGAPGGRRTRSPARRLSATVAWTSTPVRNVPSGVATRSPSPSADTPTKTMRPSTARAGTRVLQHVDGGEAREGPRRPPEPHEDAPVRLERERAVVEPQRGAPARRIGDGEPARPERRAERGEREAGIELVAELDDLVHAPEDAVRVRRGVEEAGPAGRGPSGARLQRTPVARGTVGVPPAGAGPAPRLRPMGWSRQGRSAAGPNVKA